MTTELTSTPTETIELDCSGLLCPLPVYKAALALNRLDQGQILKLITTDPGSVEDIPAMARQRGDVLLDASNADGRQVFYVEKGAGDA